ncbi:MAG: tRNA dihydrouridine synthase DusB [Eubacteriales bacterium]|nr:tRNA dihydrouridine synthase DusB [Eubacteriales bacterium]
MAGVTDLPFRTLCREMGAGLVFTEMVSAKGLSYENENSSCLLVGENEAPPVGVQLFGHDPRIIAEICSGEHLKRFDVLDLNMGCPMHKIVTNGDGSALMKHPETAEQVIRAAVRAVDGRIPVSVKFRAGWCAGSVNAVEFGQMCERAGASFLTLHARTREMMYSGKADRDLIRRLKRSVSIPVVGNGDIFSAQDALSMLEQTGCDAVMVARGARGKPWLFRQIHELLDGRSVTEPDIEEKRALAIRQLDMLIALKGERSAVLDMRKHFSWYVSGSPGSALLRSRFTAAASADEMRELVRQWV